MRRFQASGAAVRALQEHRTPNDPVYSLRGGTPLTDKVLDRGGHVTGLWTPIAGLRLQLGADWVQMTLKLVAKLFRGRGVKGWEGEDVTRNIWAMAVVFWLSQKFEFIRNGRRYGNRPPPQRLRLSGQPPLSECV